jgi:DNA-directed RNA polymerase specialized sigma24 family protein
MNRKQKRVADLLKEAPHMTADDVAKTLRLSCDFVYRTTRQFGIKYRRLWMPLTAREEKRIVHLARAGLNDTEIKDRLDISKASIQRVRLAHGLEQRGRRMGPKVDRATHVQIARMHIIEGHSYGDIAHALGVTKGVVAGAIYRAKRQKWKLRACVEKEVERA